jgi:flagellar basal-body rod modification protein FlgD
MTVISSSSGLGQVTRPQNDAAKASLDYDAFLKLLLQQLKSQDPTSPVDQKETLAQLASFSNVEQSIKLNQKMDALLGEKRLAEASSLVGKQVRSLTTGLQGIIASIEVANGGMTATLATGERLDLSDSLRISA